MFSCFHSLEHGQSGLLSSHLVTSRSAMREDCSSYDDPFALQKSHNLPPLSFTTPTPKLPITSPLLVLLLPTLAFKSPITTIISFLFAVWNSVLQLVVEFILFLIHRIICWCICLYHRQFMIVWVESKFVKLASSKPGSDRIRSSPVTH